VIDAPAPWRVVTELPAVGAETRTFRAASYEELADSPIDVGSPVVLTIRPHGIPHRISLCGDGGNYDAQKVAADLTKIVDATIDLLGASPLSSYTFFYHLNDRSDGGLEHATSNSCVIPRTTFVPDKDYKWFLGLTSHEYFHLYNVKRIRPKAFQPFDLTQEVYTRLLWWMEGTTDYFSDLVLRRAGLYTPKEYLANSAELIQRYLETPGRLRSSLEDASYLTWVDFYQPYEETLNRTVSYYLKGNLVSLCLDLELRHRTENRTSLETVLRTLWSEFGATGRGVEEDGIRAVSEQVSGLDLAPFFDRYVRGTEEIDFDAFARYAGLAFGPKAKPADDDSPVAGYLGVRAEESDGLARLRVVLAGSPARAAGLTPGDEIVAINGTRVTFTNFEKTFARYPPGTPIALTVFRRGLLREVGVTTGLPPPEKYEFRPVEAPTELAKSVFATWIGVPWEPEKPGATATPAAV
jgi:predicted metalloprotease with PDZ domain